MNLNTNRIKLWMTAAFAVAGGLAAFAQTNTFKPFEMISDRNIFDPNRRPALIRRNFTNPPPVYSFSLVGTMSYEKGMFAVFDGTSSDYHKVIESGGRIANYTVGEITHDAVKLSSGTNHVDLKVGMQMRRNTDGSWTTAEVSGENSYASRFRNNNGNGNRFDRNDRGNFDRGNFNRNGGNERRSFGNNGQNNYRTGYQSPYGRTESNGEQSGGPAQATSAAGGSSDPNDVIARLMAQRNAQMGQTQPAEGQNDGQNGQDNGGQNFDSNQNRDQQMNQGGNADQNRGGNQPENQNNQNIPNANQGGGDQPGNQNGNENVPDNSTPRL